MAAPQPVIASASDVARYFLALAADDGDLITNLKMQKLVYYAYVWTLVRHDRRLFGEPIKAWPNGPVVPRLYDELKKFGARPIDADEFGFATDEDFESWVTRRFPNEILETLNGVYERYGRMSAFDLVVQTHSEQPWIDSRGDFGPNDIGNVSIDDKQIRAHFGQ